MVQKNLEILGLTKSEDFGKLSYDYSLSHCENNYIFFNRKNHPIDDLLRVSVSVDIIDEEEFCIKDKNFFSLKGTKNYIIDFRDDKRKRVTYTCSSPFSYCFEVPCTDFKEYDIHIIDAYYKPLANKIIYENITFLILLSSNFEEKKQEFIEITDLDKNITQTISLKNDDENILIPPISNKEILKVSIDKNNDLLKNVDVFEEYL